VGNKARTRGKRKKKGKKSYRNFLLVKLGIQRVEGGRHRLEKPAAGETQGGGWQTGERCMPLFGKQNLQKKKAGKGQETARGSPVGKFAQNKLERN